MEKHRETLFKLVMASVALAHLIIGLAAFFPGVSVEKLARVFYRASVGFTPELQHVAHMFGAYMLAFGIMAAFAALDPSRNRGIVNGVIILLALRVLQRFLYAGQACETFKIPHGYFWAQTIFFLIIAAALFLLKPKAAKAPTDGQPVQ